jgi:hypothetical protein
MKRLLVLVVALASFLVLSDVAVAQQVSEFKLGFKALADQLPSVVGAPLENEHWGANGDSLQQTTTGLMAWRKADNWTAFTNGSTTWINGPNGVQSRLNSDRFPWEKDPKVPAAQPAPQPSPIPMPATVPTAPTTGQPSMQDRVAGSLLQLSDLPTGYHVVSLGWSTANGWPTGRHVVAQYDPDVPSSGPIVSQDMYLFDTDNAAQAFLERNTTNMNPVFQWVPSQLARTETVMSYVAISDRAKGSFGVYFRVHNVVGLVSTLVLGGVSTSLDQATRFAQVVVDRLVSSGG